MKKLPGLLVGLAALTAVFAQTTSVQAADWFVTTNGTGGGTNWADATNSIQGAIDASSAGDTVWVSNGVYATGGVTNWPNGPLTNRVAIYKAITVRSANNDPTNTIIKGAWDPATNGPAAVRCVYMAGGSALIGFMVTNGATSGSGDNSGYAGGVYCASTTATISNCIITGNSGYYLAGGAYQGALYNCTLIGNSVITWHGGGAYASILYNCTLYANTANYGGGARASTLYNCTVTYNWARQQGGGTYDGALYNCMLVGNYATGVAYGGGERASTLYNCTLVGNSAGTGGGAYQGTLYNCISWSNNVADYSATYYYSTINNPRFISDGSGYGASHVAGNYRLTNNSPCLNTGTNQSWMTNFPGFVDLDGLRRIRYGTVDIGAYEKLYEGTIFSIH